MSKRGAGIPCPDVVAERLRRAGWRGYNGWWLYEIAGYTWSCRWYEALCLHMGSRHVELRRPHDKRQPDGPRCPRTAEMFNQ